MKKYQKGFTLIELLVVIAIIGILSSVVLANLNGTRQKARDVKRIADIKQLQLALALYFDANGKYPGELADLASVYIPNVPHPPSLATDYNYVPLSSSLNGQMCNNYHLGTVLELSGNTVLTNDSDASGGTVASNCRGSIVTGSLFDGASTDCGSTTGIEQCFDVTP